MEYAAAAESQVDELYELVQRTIRAVYPRYYPQAVVESFCGLHSRDAIAADVAAEREGVVLVDGRVVGTGCRDGNHITRVYVSPAFQGRGVGSFIMQRLEDEIARDHATALLDASLPATSLYEHRGYRTLRHEQFPVEDEAVLVYAVMEKELGAEPRPGG